MATRQQHRSRVERVAALAAELRAVEKFATAGEVDYLEHLNRTLELLGSGWKVTLRR